MSKSVVPEPSAKSTDTMSKKRKKNSKTVLPSLLQHKLETGGAVNKEKQEKL